MGATDRREEHLARELVTRREGNEVAKADVFAGLFACEKLAEVVRADEGPETTRALLHVDGRDVERDTLERRPSATRALEVDITSARPSGACNAAHAHLDRRGNGTPTSRTGDDWRLCAARRACARVG
jgi:hypothetical protein